VFYYKLSNTLFRDFSEDLSNKNERKIAIEKTIEIFKDLKEKNVPNVLNLLVSAY